MRFRPSNLCVELCLRFSKIPRAGFTSLLANLDLLQLCSVSMNLCSHFVFQKEAAVHAGQELKIILEILL